MKIVIIGGVAGGASVAARARRLDEQAEIIILERSQYVSFANCGLPYHIGGVIAERRRLLLMTPERFQARFNVDVRVRNEVVAINRAARTVTVRRLDSGEEYTERYDKLVLSPGAGPIRPPLPGIDHPLVRVLRNVEDMDAIQQILERGAKSAVVIGGGFIGLEMAENLRERGLDIDLVEMLDQILAPLDPEMARDVEVAMGRHGVRIHLEDAAESFTEQDGRVCVRLRSGRELLTDLVILSVGVRPESTLAREAGLVLGERGGIRVDASMCTSDPDIYAAGDAVEVVDTITGAPALIPLAGPANRQGRIVADNICGRSSTYSTTQGTAVAKVFELTAAATGAAEKTLRRVGMAYRKIYLHPANHAGYYPGAAPMQIKVLFTPDTGRLLGAQIVGKDGVDKRIDLLAMAIRAGMSVFDLEHFEFAYAPPYGSGKDPINMVGFIGSNLLRGDVEMWYAEDFPAVTTQGQVLDVRTPKEYHNGHIPGALNVNVDTLRESLDQLPRDRILYAYCRVGFRSYLAYRLLVQQGFQVRSLSGGILSFISQHGKDALD